MKKNILTKLITSSFVVLLGVITFTSCEEDSLPEAGSIPDLTGPSGAFAVSNGNTSSLVKVFRNTSQSATGAVWSFPEGIGEFISECEALGTTGCSTVTSVDTDEQVFYKFNEFGTFEIGIQASDDLGVISEVSTAPVTVVSSGAPEPTVMFDVEKPEGSNNGDRVLTNRSANDDGGILWSATLDGEEIPISDILVSDDSLQGRDQFLGQTENSEEIFVSFQGLGDFQVTVTATNFDGVEVSDTQTVSIGQLPTPVPTFSVSADSNYGFYTFVNTTPDTAEVEWTLPAGASFANDSEPTDAESIDVSFDAPGTYDITLKVFSDSFDNDNQPIVIDGESTTSTPVLTPMSDIATPVIFRGGFEPGEITNPADCINNPTSCRVVGRFDNDQGKEWWIADGFSERVYLFDELDANGGTIPDPTQTIIETGLQNQSWFGEASGFNRLNITGNARTGARAASFDPTRPTRVAVQEIEVTPGADYKISYWVNNVNAVAGASLKVFVLKPTVENDIQANLLENRLNRIGEGFSSSTTNNTPIYVEESVEFNAGDNNSVKLYFYPTDPTLTSFFLDDVSIAID